MGIEELIETAQEFRDGILNGRRSNYMCAAISWPLQGYLSLLGVETEVCTIQLRDRGKHGNGCLNHVFLKLPDGRILDPTADQFDDELPPVYLGSPLWMHTDAKPEWSHDGEAG